MIIIMLVSYFTSQAGQLSHMAYVSIHIAADSSSQNFDVLSNQIGYLEGLKNIFKKKLGIGCLYQLFVPIPFQAFWSPYFDIFQQGLYMSVSFKAPYYLYQSPRAESLSSWWPRK